MAQSCQPGAATLDLAGSHAGLLMRDKCIIILDLTNFSSKTTTQ